jgi:hypothetical protein
MTPRPLLHLEGAAVFALSLCAYQWGHGSWLQFALLFLVPDNGRLGMNTEHFEKLLRNKERELQSNLAGLEREARASGEAEVRDTTDDATSS